MFQKQLAIAFFLILAFVSASFQYYGMVPVFAQSENFTLSEAKIKKMDKALSAKMSSTNDIIQDGSKGAMGVAILSDKGFESVIASTTHGGVLDSIQQDNASDPVWHNHFVKLVANNSSKCGNNPQVEELTFQSPGSVSINGTSLQMAEVPQTFNATGSLSNSSLVFESGSEIDKVVTFNLEPQFDSQNNIEVVCVTNIQPVGNLTME
jgi:hypothetical protein